MKKNYRVTWMIDVEGDNPHDAVKQTVDIQRDPESIATHFTVENTDNGQTCDIDLYEDETDIMEVTT